MRYFLVTVIALIVAGGAYAVYRVVRPADPLPVATSIATTTPTATVAAPAVTATEQQDSANEHSGMQLYRNDEFGFEFWHPDDWEWQANVFGSQSSRFNLTLMSINGAQTYQEDVINIVTKTAADNAVKNFRLAHATEKAVVIDGIQAMSYDYAFNGPPMVSILVTFRNDPFLLTFNQDLKPEFEAILSTFKFLK